VLHSVLVLLAEVFGAVALGCLAGVMLYFLLKLTRAEDKILDFTLGALLLVVGISMIPRIDPILPAMTLGVTVANIMPRQSKTVFKLVETFAPPIYISFFVLAGAHMEFGRITPWMLAIILIYVVFRGAGKIAGVQLGGAVAKAPAVVRNYLGLCLMPQAGVAIGLAILASRQFNGEIGHTIILIIMTSTFALELIGPMLVKVGVKRAGEIGLNITEADLIESYRVADVMQTDVPTIDQGMLLSDILAVVSGTEGAYYAVVDGSRNLLGAITLEGIRKTFATQEINDWLVALDIMEPIEGKLTPEMPLAEALEQTALLNAEHMPVVAADDGTFLGVFGERHVRRMLSAEVLLRQRKAEGVASA
jgi:CBS domain-containing protein